MRHIDNPEWAEIGRKNYEKRLTDASDCWDFEEIEDKIFLVANECQDFC